jgi:nucleotide-binding universal stress UspA family protein
LSTDATPTILLCYDGSEHATHAISVTAALFPGATVKVLHVWEPVEHIIARYAVLAPYLGGELIPAADAGAEEQSDSLADEGAKLATQAGLIATAHTAKLSNTVWEAVVEASTSLGAQLIVTGTRSLRGVHELVVGTLSHSLLQHSALPLLAIPAPLPD